VRKPIGSGVGERKAWQSPEGAREVRDGQGRLVGYIYPPEPEAFDKALDRALAVIGYEVVRRRRRKEETTETGEQGEW
jgi:hypothetical protein